MGTAESMKLSPDQARRSVVPIVSAIACAASGGTALPILSRQSASERPSSSRYSSGSTRLCRDASSRVVKGRCQVPSRLRMTATSRS